MVAGQQCRTGINDHWLAGRPHRAPPLEHHSAERGRQFQPGWRLPDSDSGKLPDHRRAVGHLPGQADVRYRLYAATADSDIAAVTRVTLGGSLLSVRPPPNLT